MGRNTLSDLSKLTRPCDLPSPGGTEKAGAIDGGQISFLGEKYAFCVLAPHIPASELADGEQIEYFLIRSHHINFADDCISSEIFLGRQIGAKGKGADEAFFASRFRNGGGQYTTLKIVCSAKARPSARSVNLFLAVW